MSVGDDDAVGVLMALRQQLLESGYGALVVEHDLETERLGLTPAAAVQDLVVRLRSGVVPAILAHAESIRNLEPRPGPHGPLWEPLPRGSYFEEIDSEDEFVVVLEQDEANRLEGLAVELDELLRDLEGRANANEA